MSQAKTAPVIVWFRQDLRLADNPALAAAVAGGRSVLPVYVLDDDNAGSWSIGAAGRWWLHQSLAALDRSLDGTLCLLRGPADREIPALMRRTGAVEVHVNRCFEPWRVARDARIAAALDRAGRELHVHAGSTLFDPDRIVKNDGTPYRVFTPFYRAACRQGAEPPREPLAPPARIAANGSGQGLALDQLGLMPAIGWYRGIADSWQPGEDGALARLDRFLDAGLDGYREGRNRPDLEHVSRLSPHLHFGEISPNQVWYAVLARCGRPGPEADVDCFLRELGWREFSYYLLHHFPDLPTDNLQPRFDRFPWQSDAAQLERWQRGQTGIPLVDAGMRELWQTGYMHNRVRMVVASFLVKNLLLDWRHGERWFRDTLVDADLANNSASWQWVAGSGADAAPYFRIFNPVTQGLKFDPEGNYVRRYVPELAALAGAKIHEPWKAPREVRAALDYPEPVVDLKISRERALAAFRASAN